MPLIKDFDELADSYLNPNNEDGLKKGQTESNIKKDPIDDNSNPILISGSFVEEINMDCDSPEEKFEVEYIDKILNEGVTEYLSTTLDGFMPEEILIDIPQGENPEVSIDEPPLDGLCPRTPSWWDDLGIDEQPDSSDNFSADNFGELKNPFQEDTKYED